MNRPKLNPRKQKGIALIVALLVVTIVAGMALMFTERQQMWMRQLEVRNNFTLATTATFSAIHMARLTLRDDARRNQVDHQREAWTIPIPPMSVENGRISGHLRELNGHFNLYNLLPTDGSLTVSDDSTAIKRAASAVGITNGDLVKVLRAILTVRKAEPKSTPELEEAMRRTDLSADSREALRRHTIVLPESTPINVNFADAEALQAAIAGLSASDASNLISRRAGSPFMTLASFTSALPESLRQSVDSSAVSVQSTYFLVQIDAWFDDIHMGYESMLLRSGTELPTILWTRRAGLANS